MTGLLLTATHRNEWAGGDSASPPARNARIGSALLFDLLPACPGRND